MTVPPLPAGRPVAPPTTQSELAQLRHRIDELTRQVKPVGQPVCRLTLAVDVPMAANADVFAQNNWQVGTGPDGVGEDPDGMATLSTTSGTLSTIRIPRTGRYFVYSRGIFTNPAAGGSCVAYVMRGSPDNGSSLARDPRNTTGNGGDGTVCYAPRSRRLLAGDVLYWGHWSNVAITLSHLVFNVPTEICVTWQGTR